MRGQTCETITPERFILIKNLIPRTRKQDPFTQASKDQAEGRGKGAEVLATIPSVEALVEVYGVLAGDHLILPSAAGALLLLRHRGSTSLPQAAAAA